MRIFLLGLPGAGKGTQGRKLAEHLECPHISLGDCVREIIKTESPLANEIMASFASSRWSSLPDTLAFRVFQQFALPDCVMDGFPRNVAQWKLLKPQDDDRFIYLEISKEESCNRIMQRNRSDDALASWERRIEAEELRLPELLNVSGALTVSGVGAVDEVFEEVLQNIFYAPWQIRLSESGDVLYSPHHQGIGGDSPVMIKIEDEHFLAPSEKDCPEFWLLLFNQDYPKIKQLPPQWEQIKEKILADCRKLELVVDSVNGTDNTVPFW